jgi:hypothetical protein
MRLACWAVQQKGKEVQVADARKLAGSGSAFAVGTVAGVVVSHPLSWSFMIMI